MVKKTRIGINGFGRIGRTLYRLLHEHPGIEVGLVNDLSDAPTLAHLLKYDSIHGVLPFEVHASESHFGIGAANTPLSRAAQPGDIPWKKHGVELVVEATLDRPGNQ